MATRDVQLIIKARDEASRALNDIAAGLTRLDSKQKSSAASGSSLGAALGETVRSMADMERATGLVVAASDRAEAAINGQRNALKGTAADLAAVTAQLGNARNLIGRQQEAIVATLFKGGDATALIASTKAAQAAVADLEREESSLAKTLTRQQSVLDQQEANFRELAAMANSAEAALGGFGDAQARDALKSLDAAQALDEQAAAARRLADAKAEAAQARFNGIAGVSADPRGAQAAESAAVFEEAFARQAAAVQRLQDRIDPLAALERRLAGEQRLLKEALDSGTLSARQYEKALEQLHHEADLAREAFARVGRGERGRVALFGLKPYELTNLGYQVNDLITQVASGTSVFQALAQQGGQILQLLPGLQSRLLAILTNPYALAFAATMGAVALAIREAATDAERLRKIEGLLSTIGEQAGVTAGELAATAEAMERIGLSASDALGLVRTFLTQGLNIAYLEDFATSARDFADVTGKDIPEALKAQTEAFTKGYSVIADLDNQWTFLTLAERENIRAMFDSGRAAEGREKAFALFRKEMDKQADLMRGSWTSAVRSLERALDDLIDKLGETTIAKAFNAALDDIGRNISFAISDVEDRTTDLIDDQLEQLRKRLEVAEKGGLTAGFAGADPAALKQQIADLEAQRNAIVARQRATGDLRDEESEAAKKRESDTLRQIRRERELSNARDAANRIRLEGEKAYQEAVEAGHSKRVAQARKEQAIERQTREERKKAEAEFAAAIADSGRQGLVDTASRFVGRNENRAGDRNVLSDFFKAANVNIDPKITAWCAAFVNAVLATNGLPTVSQSTGGNDLRARDFLGYGSEVTKPEPGDIVILKRGGGGQGHVGLFQGFADNGDVKVLGGNQRDGVNTSTFRAKDVLGFRRAPSLGDVAEDELKALQKRTEQQDAFNQKIDDEIVDRLLAVELQHRLIGLSGTALLDEQKRQAVNEAVRTAQQEALEKDLQLSEDRVTAIREAAGAEFDLANARARASAAMDDATKVRDALLGQLDLAREVGNPAAIAAVETELRGVEQALADGIRATIEYYRTLGDTAEVRAKIIELETALGRVGRDAFQRERTAVEKPVSDLQAKRNALLEQASFFNDLGETAVAEQLREQVRALDAELLKAIDSAILFWQAQNGPEAEAAILNFQNLRNQVLVAQNEFVITAKQVQDAFAGSLIDAFDTFAQKLVETRDPLQALGYAALQFAADFTKKLADMGLQLLAFQLASKLGFKGIGGVDTRGLTVGAAALGGAGAAVAAGGKSVQTGAAALAASAAALAVAARALTVANSIGAGAGVAHGGAIIGHGFNRTRRVHPAWFANATRYHSGGVAGLRPDEVPTILQRGEEVITRSDSRHRLNGGGRGGEGSDGKPRSESWVLAIGDDQITSAMRNASGERVTLMHLRNNKETIRTMLRD